MEHAAREGVPSERLLTTYDFSEPVTSVVLPGLEVNFARIIEEM